MNRRTCIVTRKEKTADEMIRFVLDSDGNVVPDIKRKLPGRGVWVTATRKSVEEAVCKGGFSRGFKQAVQADRQLPNLVETLLEEEVVSTLAMARKAGQLVTGREKVEKKIRTGKAGLLVHAIEAEGDGRRKLDALSRRWMKEEDVLEALKSETYDRITGGANTMHLAISAGKLAVVIKNKLSLLHRYRAMENGES